MTARRPLVVVSGATQELPTADTLATVGDSSGIASLDSTTRLPAAQAPRVASSVRSSTGVSGTISIDSSLNGNNRDIELTGDAALSVPTNGVNHQVLQVVAWASGAQRTLTIDAGYELLVGISATQVIPSGKKLRLSLRCSTIDGTTDWLVEAAAATQ